MQKKLTLTLTLAALGCMCWFGCSRQQIITPAQKMQAEIVAVYQIPGGAWETCLKHDDGTRSLWPNHKLGEPGDKFSIWKRGCTQWLQDPN